MLNTDWIINEKNGFMNDPSLASSRFFLRESVLKFEGRLTRLRIPVKSGKIISDQMFGFWIAFFISHHYSLGRDKDLQE